MTKIDGIKRAIAQLTPAEMKEFRAWFEELREQQWDEQIARDEEAGNLDKLAAEALAEHESGKTRCLR